MCVNRREDATIEDLWSGCPGVVKTVTGCFVFLFLFPKDFVRFKYMI